MIREELLHPIISHFPICLLVLVVFTKLAELIVIKKYNELGNNLNLISKFCLFVGSIMLLPALFLGDMAFDVVKNDICNLTVAYKHEDLAHSTIITFIFAITFETLLSIKKIKSKYANYLQIALVFTLFLGNYFLFKTSHLGGELVYEQGAGVKRAMKKCD